MREYNIKCFGMIAEWAGGDAQQLPLDGNPTVRTLPDAAEQRWPRLKGISYRVAVNQRLSDDSDTVSEKDEIALLPPFAGG